MLQPASRQEQSIHIVENLKYLLCNKYSELSQIHLVYGHMRATIAFPESLVFLYVLFIYHTPLFSTPPKKILPSIPLPSSCAASIYREKKKEKETYVAQARLLRSIMYADETVSRRFQYLGHSPHRRHFSIHSLSATERNEKGKGGVWCSYTGSPCRPSSVTPERSFNLNGSL